MGYGEEGRHQLVFPNVEDIGTFYYLWRLAYDSCCSRGAFIAFYTVMQETSDLGLLGRGGLLGLKQIPVLEMTDFRSVVCTLCICDVVF